MTPRGEGVVRALAGFDLVVTGLLAFPISAHGFVALLYRVNGLFGGVSTPPFFDSIHWLFVNLAGVLGVLWALARLIAPTPLLVGLDSGGRVVVSLVLVGYVFGGSAPGLLLLFAATELAGTFLQLRWLRTPAQ